jgi:hypothetical protein
MLTDHVIRRKALAACVLVVTVAAGSSVGLAENTSQGAGANTGSAGGNLPSVDAAIAAAAATFTASSRRGRLALSISGKTQPGEGAAPYVPQKGPLKTNVCNFQHVCD